MGLNHQLKGVAEGTSPRHLQITPDVVDFREGRPSESYALQERKMADDLMAASQDLRRADAGGQAIGRPCSSNSAGGGMAACSSSAS